MRLLLLRLAAQFCAECERPMWPWQHRCGGRHSVCKHAGDRALWERNDYPVPMWACSYCGKVPQ